MLGLQRYSVRVSAPNTCWADDYACIAQELLAATHGLDLQVEHIGSTSVPGLDAKPIIDVGVLLHDTGRFPELVCALEATNLIYRGDKGSNGGRLFIRELSADFRTHHVHVYFEGAPEWDRYLLFRDRLRKSHALRAEYGELKRALAARYPNDPLRYMAGKTSFVYKVLSDED